MLENLIPWIRAAEEKRLTNILKQHELWETIVLSPDPYKNNPKPEWLHPAFVGVKSIQIPEQIGDAQLIKKIDEHFTYLEATIAGMPDLQEKSDFNNRLNELKTEWNANGKERHLALDMLYKLEQKVDAPIRAQQRLFEQIYITNKREKLVSKARECLTKWNGVENRATPEARKNAVTKNTTELTYALHEGAGNEDAIYKAMKAFDTPYMSRIARNIPEPSEKAIRLARIIDEQIKELQREVTTILKNSVTIKPKDKARQINNLIAAKSYLENEIDRNTLADILKANKLDKTKSRFGFSERDPVKSLIDQACAIRGDKLSALLKDKPEKKQTHSRTPSPRRS